MKFGIRKPSLKKRIAARTSGKLAIKNALGIRTPKGWGWVTNPKRAAYNKVYNKTSKGCLILFVLIPLLSVLFIYIIVHNPS